MSDHEAFVNKLTEILNEQPAGNLLSIPGVYEILSEEFNNEVLERLEQEKNDKEFGITFTEDTLSLFHTGYDFDTVEHAREVAHAVLSRGNPSPLTEEGHRWDWLDADGEFEVTHATIQTKDDDVVTVTRED